MKEVEILVKLHCSKKEAENTLEKFKFVASKKTTDEYYYKVKGDKLNPQSDMPREWFRLRDKQGKYYICYKIDKFSGKKWMYSDEYETEIYNLKEMRAIISQLGYKKLVIVKVIKHIYEYKYFEIVLEEVEKLGLFLEIEAKINGEVKALRKEILNLIKSLNLEFEEVNMGKPELLLEKLIRK